MATYKQLKGRTLQDWYTIEIDRSGDSVYVTMHSRIHVNKEVKVSHCYSHQFTDGQILHDSTLYTWIVNRYGSDIFA